MQRSHPRGKEPARESPLFEEIVSYQPGKIRMIEICFSTRNDNFSRWSAYALTGDPPHLSVPLCPCGYLLYHRAKETRRKPTSCRQRCILRLTFSVRVYNSEKKRPDRLSGLTNIYQ